MDEAVYSGEYLNRCFRKDLFFCAYFSPVYINYSSDFEVESDLSFFIHGDTPVDYRVKQMLNKRMTEFGSKEIRHKGIHLDKETSELSENQSISESSDYTGHYLLDGKTNCLNELSITWKTENGKKTIDVIIYKIEDISENSVFIVDEPEKEKEKKGFLSFLFGE
jgi:hypothetical protein